MRNYLSKNVVRKTKTKAHTQVLRTTQVKISFEISLDSDEILR